MRLVVSIGLAAQVAWHQGGPGGSSTQGGMIEMGFFQVDSNGTHTNSHAWNNAANMLYLESPAGSGQNTGFSTCSRGGKIVDCCWDDKTQGVAYGHTLLAFIKSFPELATRDFYLAGESYFGQYGPNIAHTILSAPATFSAIPLKGLLVGNGCWGGDATSVECNGPNSDQNDVELYLPRSTSVLALSLSRARSQPFSLITSYMRCMLTCAILVTSSSHF